jgi:glycosyltransferase involved in cell wall biosynthesis
MIVAAAPLRWKLQSKSMDKKTLARKPSITVVFPTFDEEANVVASVEGVRRALRDRHGDVEVVIVDGGSTGRTPALADGPAAAYADVKTVHHDRNYKLGRTPRPGFAATKDLVLYTDADMPIDFRDIHRGVELLLRDGADVVAGYRLERGDSWWRGIYSAVYNRPVNAVFGLGVKDVNSPYKLFTKGAFLKLAPTSEGSFIDAEILARAKIAAMRVAQIGVHYFPRRAGRSTLASPGVILKILAEMGRFWWRVWRPGGGRRGERRR